jgi:large subunit ribosomal protein L22
MAGKGARKKKWEWEPAAKARLRYSRTSAQKARLVTELIRGKTVEEALGILQGTKKAVSRDVEKLLRSAMANAEHSEVKDVESLYVSKVYVDGGPTLKRVRARAMGRAFRILKRMCHISIELAAKAG